LEAYWKEDGRDVSRRFSENAYGDGIAERKAREGDQLPKQSDKMQNRPIAPF
jgi:hypothetical protein